MKTLPMNELRALLAAVSQHGDRHLIEIESDLQQTTFLLSEAIEKLSLSFMAIHSQLVEQQNTIEQLHIEGELSINAKEALSVFEKNIGNHVSNVVTGMQFQDMTNQLLERTIKRVNGLKELLQELASHEHPASAEDEHEEILNFLAGVNQRLNNGSQYLSGNLRKSVRQSNLNTGDIDLF